MKKEYKSKILGTDPITELITDTDIIPVTTPVNRVPDTPIRDAKGRYLKGCTGNAEGRKKDSLAALCRGVVERRKLIPLLGEIGAGVNQYKRAELSVRVRCIQLLMQYGWGSPIPINSQEAAAYEESIRFSMTKRIIGISDDDI